MRENINPSFVEWIRNLDEEIIFWDDLFKKILERRVRRNAQKHKPKKAVKASGMTSCPLAKEINSMPVWKYYPVACKHCPLIEKTAARMKDQNIKILDVGSGPMTAVGLRQKDKKKKTNVEIIACDPLAYVYNALMDRYKLESLVRPFFADSENLSLFFKQGHFDIITCNNALDHSYDPAQGILQMLWVLKPGGVIYLTHFENEAEHNLYHGLHQWNMANQDGDYIIWNKKYRTSLREIFGKNASVHARDMWSNTHNRRLSVCAIELHRHDGALRQKIKPDLPLKYQAVMDQLMEVKLTQIAPKPDPKPGRKRKRKLLAALGLKRYKDYRVS